MKSTILKNAMAAVGMFVCTSSVWAADIEPPTLPIGIEPTDGAKVMLYNVEAELCVGNGKINAPWATSTILMENGGGLLFELCAQADGTWSLKTASGEHAGKYTFTPTAEGDRPFCYIDMAGDWQGCRTWNVEALPEGGYTLALTDTNLAEEGTYLGTDGMSLDVRCNVDPNDGAFITWLFLEGDAISIYQARNEFYELISEAELHPLVKLDAYVEAYNNPELTLEELKKFINSLKADINAALIAEDDIQPSPEDPFDVTDLYFENPRFDDSVDGWQNVGGMTKDPNSTPYGESVQDFAEKWAWNAPLGREVALYQVLSLPSGLYRAEVDAIATAQYDGGITVSGVKFYVKNGSESSVKVATANEAPQHYTIEFLADGAYPTEIGIHVDATTEANWVAVDNFQLWYMGQVDMSEAYVALKNTIGMANGSIPADDVDGISANNALKAEYAAALASAEETLENSASDDAALAAANKALASALEALLQSKSDYAALQTLCNKFGNLSGALLDIDIEGVMEAAPIAYSEELESLVYAGECDAAEEVAKYQQKYDVYNSLYETLLWTAQRKTELDDDVLVGMIEQKEEALRAAWVEETYTTAAEVAAAKDAIASMIANYLNASIKPGDDLTAMISNPNFEENADGWDRNGFDNPGYSYSCVEYFQKNFNFSQTLKGMPKGRYTLTCQGYQRRGSGINAVLYANDNEILLHDVRDEARDPGYFGDDGAYPHDSHGDEGFYPNSMEGASLWFAAEDVEEPLYLNKLDFFLTDSESTDLTIGVRSSANSDWCLFDNFQLIYHGNRAEDYAEAIQELIEEINELMQEGYPTKTLNDHNKSVIDAANAAIKTDDANACIAAIPALKDLLHETKETLALTQALAEKYEYFQMERVDLLPTSAAAEFEKVMQEYIAGLTSGALNDVKDIQAYADNLDTKYVQALQAGATEASEEKPFDMTAAIANPSYECWYAANDDVPGSEYNAYGWSWDGTAPSCNEYSAEVWNQKCHVYQTIKGLAPGYYKLHVQGYHRKGHGNDKVDEFVSNADLYAGEYRTRLMDILECASLQPLYDGDEGDQEGTIEMNDEIYYFPQNMPQTLPYYEEGLYINTLVFKIEEGQKEITIGLQKETLYDWDSTMFDNWSLEFVGANKPAQENTAISAVQFGDAVSTQAFSLNGVRLNTLQRGVNILKTADKQGNVRVRKVLVK